MEIVNLLFENLMHIMFPVFIYLLYVCYKKIYDKKENDLVLILLISAILYIVIKFNNIIFEEIPFMAINLALIISFLKKSNIGIIISSIFSISYYYEFYNDFLLVFVFMYIIYYLIYLKVKRIPVLISLVMLMHMVIIMIFTVIISDNVFVSIYKTLFMAFLSYEVIHLTIFVIGEAENLFKLHKSNKELMHDKEIKNSLFQITHEIKNPIAVCKGYLDMFDTDNKEHAEKYIPIMKSEISRTLYLLEDFLAMNKIKVSQELLDINLLLEEVSNHFKPIFKEKNIVFNENLIDDEIYIEGDYNRLNQVFLNIFKNSIEAINESGKIDLWTNVKNGKIYIHIKDSGCGISPVDMKHIKEAFYTTKVRGTGLGVSLSNEIILAHNGELLYESKEGEYTLVTIILNIKKVDD